MPRIDQLSAHPKTTASPFPTTAQFAIRDAALSSLNTRNIPLTDIRSSIFVTDYGAVGDNSANDTASIQAAINACPNGGHVHFPRGKYKITSAINCTTVAIRITGAGGMSQNDGGYNGSSLIVSGSGQVGFDYNRSASTAGALIHEGPTIENINFVDATRSGTGNATLVSLYNTNYWTLRNCSFRPADSVAVNKAGTGILTARSFDGLGDSAWGYISQCHFIANSVAIDGDGGYTMVGGNIYNGGVPVNTGNIGIRLSKFVGSAVIQGVKFDGGGLTNILGIHINGAAWTKVLGCNFENVATGIKIDRPTGGLDAQQNQIIGNAFTDGCSAGVLFTDVDTTGTMLIANVFNGMLNPTLRVSGPSTLTLRLDMNTVSSAAYTITNSTVDRAIDANSTTIDEVADVLGTLIADLKISGLIQ